jgi:hypothetical protein
MKTEVKYKKDNIHVKTIVAIDEVLGMLREKWMSEKDDAAKSKVMTKIDSVLDERGRLMKLRDEHEKA